MQDSDEQYKKEINNILKEYKNIFNKIKSEVSNVFSLEYGLSSKKPEGLFFLSFNEEQKKEIKEEMILKLKWIFNNYIQQTNYLNRIAKELVSKVSKKDAFYYGLINNINEYLSKLRNIAFDCQRIDKYYKLNTSKNLPDIKNYTYSDYCMEFKYLSDISLGFSLELSQFKTKNEEYDYDNNIDANELKIKCGKTLSNDYNTISDGYTMRNRSFVINHNLRTNGINSLNDSDKKVINALIKTCLINPCYKNMILFRFVEQNFIKKLFGVQFDNFNESSVSDAVNQLHSQWRKEIPIKLEGGFISSSYIYSKNVFQNRDVMLKLYIPKGTPIYATDNDGESEIIICAGVNYVFFDAFYEKVTRFNENFYRLILKAFIKLPTFDFLKTVKNPPPIITVSFGKSA